MHIIIKYYTNNGPIYVPLDVLSTLKNRRKYFRMYADSSLHFLNYFFFKSKTDEDICDYNGLVDDETLCPYYTHSGPSYVKLKLLVKEKTRII